MSSRQRIVLLALAAVVLVVGIVLATSSGDDDEPSSSTTTPAAAQTGSSAPASTTGEAPAPPAVETIRIRAGKPVGQARTIVFEHGDTIRLRFVSDAPGEVHIHGYDREFEVGPGEPKTVRFKAQFEGIFEIEDHDSEALLAKLQVQPK